MPIIHLTRVAYRNPASSHHPTGMPPPPLSGWQWSVFDELSSKLRNANAQPEDHQLVALILTKLSGSNIISTTVEWEPGVLESGGEAGRFLAHKVGPDGSY